MRLQEFLELLKRETAGSGDARVTATVQCYVAPSATGEIALHVLTGNVVPESHRGLHSVTVELGHAGREPLRPNPQDRSTIPPAQHSTSSAAPSPEFLPELTRLFGPPGFDNAARASVFREIIEELTAEQLRALLAALREDSAEVPQQKPADSAVAMARMRLVRVLKLGPAGVQDGLRIVDRLLTADQIAPLLQLIRTVWKTQEEWVNTTPPGVRFQ